MRDWIELEEYGEVPLQPDDISTSKVHELYRRYAGPAGALEVVWPSPATHGRYLLRARGKVGALPVAAGGGVRIKPKVPIESIFGMLEVAYDISIGRFEGTVPVESIDELFNRLAIRLATLVKTRIRIGLARDYQTLHARLPYVRGRISIRHLAATVDKTTVDCSYDEHTPDIIENQIPVWTLHRLVRSDALQPGTRQHLQRILHAIGTAVSIQPIHPHEAVRPHYDRLKADYRPIHLLCRFFLEHAGPTHRHGSHETTSFMLDMPRLFERYVAIQLARALPNTVQLKAHERVDISREHGLRFDIDLVLRDPKTGANLAVLDTKYKTTHLPAETDIHQVVSYAVAIDAPVAILIFPTHGNYRLADVGHVAVRRMEWMLHGTASTTAEQFTNSLISITHSSSETLQAHQSASES